MCLYLCMGERNEDVKEREREREREREKKDERQWPSFH